MGQGESLGPEITDMRTRQRLIIIVALIFSLLLLLRIMDVSALRDLREALFAPLQQVESSELDLGRVAIVAIDEKSLSSEGQWPWPRERIATLVERVAAGKPAAIGLGFLTSEQDRLSPANDRALADAMRAAPTVLATAAAPVLDDGRVSGLKLLQPTPVLSGTAAGFGMITTMPQPDGRTRAMPARLELDGIVYPSFGIELVRVATGVPALVTRTDGLVGTRIAVGDIDVSPDRAGAVWMRFASGDSIKRISAAALLASPDAAAGLANRIVVVGPTAAGLTGLSLSPGGEVLLDVELQSMFAANLIGEQEFSRPLYLVLLEMMVAALVSAAALWLYFRNVRLSKTGIVVTLMAVTGSFGLLSWLLAVQADLLFDATLPVLALLLTSLVIFADWRRHVRQLRYAREQDRVTAMLMVRTSENARRNFYENLSHELRTPLNMIVAGAEMIRDGVLGPVSPPEYSRYADDIHESGVRITRMFERMIDLGSAKAERIRIEEVEFPLAKALDHALLATGAPRAFHLDMPETMPKCVGDRKMIEIALASIAENALKFRSGKVPVFVEVARRTGRLEIAIEDDGPGLSAEQIAVIGQLHVDGNIHAARLTRGLGLGLALTRSIMELHGGGIDVERGRLGAFSRIILRIPSQRLIW